MEYSKYIFCNLPSLRQITTLDGSVISACSDMFAWTEENQNYLKQLDAPLRNSEFWEAVMRTEGCLKKLIPIFFENGQAEVTSILEKAHRDDKTDQLYTFINYLKPLNVKVIRSAHGFFPDDAYKLESPGVGIAFIISVLTPDSYGWSQYKSKQDVGYLEDLWSKMGYKVIHCEAEFNYNEFTRTIKDLVEIAYANEYCMSLMVYLRCRGDNGNFTLSDGTTHKIINHFLLGLSLELNVGLFKNKPKFFIIQVPGFTSRILANNRSLHYFCRHSMVCHFSEPVGHQELNVNVGSWLLYNMVDIFMREAYEIDLEGMLNQTWANVEKIFGLEAIQLMGFKNYGMKTLYFNVMKKEKVEYKNYFLRHTPYLSAVCRKKIPEMKDIINDCVREQIFTQEEKESLITNNNDIATSFWKFVPLNENCLNILKDIFYNHKMPEVVDTLHKAKKDDGSDDKYRGIEDKHLLKVKVERPLHSRRRNDDYYCLQEEFIGIALVINIIEYDKCGLRRHGAEYDTTYMKELWSQMGYKVMCYEGNIKKRDFLEKLTKLRTRMQTLNKMCAKPVAQSCIVYIGCHGSDGQLIMSDNSKINFYEEVVLQFNAKHLIGVPKIFIVQCCQIFKSDVEHKFIKAKQKKVANMHDLILCFSTLRGEPSSRDSFVGSLYVYALTHVFMKNAYNMELRKMLHEVTRYMCTEFNFEDDNQMPYFEPSHDMKNLYFNIKP